MPAYVCEEYATLHAEQEMVRLSARGIVTTTESRGSSNKGPFRTVTLNVPLFYKSKVLVYL